MELLTERLLKGEIDQKVYEKLSREFEADLTAWIPIVPLGLPQADSQQLDTLQPLTPEHPIQQPSEQQTPEPQQSPRIMAPSPSIVTKPEKICPNCTSIMAIYPDGSAFCKECEYKETP